MIHPEGFTRSRLAAVAIAALAATMLTPLAAQAADALLSGAVKSADGKAMGGVTVSAKAAGTSITTTVFTDDTGNYYFPPLPSGRYRVWAQALTFEPGKGEVDLSANRRQDFALKPMKDFVRQLPGDALLAALPQETPADANLQRVVRNNCTGCHTASYVLQHRFDEDGWRKIVELMKNINGGGVDQRPQGRPPNGVLDQNEKELAAYLARARGPGETSMKFDKLRPRPSGETARVVFKEYDVPIDPELGDEKTTTNDGTDWSQGTPSRKGSIVHDAWADLDGNLWFTANTPNRQASIGRIDGKTGAYKTLKVNGQKGLAGNSHGLTRDPKGMLWFNINTGRGSLARLDPKTERIDVFVPPQGMSATGGATTVDYDGKGQIWVTSDDGALRFDPVAEKFVEFKSVTYKVPNGTVGRSYGLAADRDGNGWWAQMQIDTIGRGDSESGKATEIKLPPVKAELDRLSAAQRSFYEGMTQPDFNTPVPFSQGPRRMGTDKNGDVLWVGNSWGGSLARINTKTGDTTFVPLPDPNAQQPYQIAVDATHAAWTNMWATDQVARFDPATSKWTLFDLPSRGTEVRYVSLDERDGKTNVILPYSRTSKIAVMTPRTEAEIAALKAKAQP
jgi:streptogramin lyase